MSFKISMKKMNRIYFTFVTQNVPGCITKHLKALIKLSFFKIKRMIMHDYHKFYYDFLKNKN